MIPGWLRWKSDNRGLVFALWGNALLLLGGLLALPFDMRHILGLNPWIKPLKFDLSIIVFLVTMAWILHSLAHFRKISVGVAWGIGVSMLIENGIISMQSFRGVRSHMNYTTLFDGVAFGIMGLLIALSTVLVAVVLLLYCIRRPALPVAVAWGVRLGLLALLAGSAEGVRMVSHGAHTVGAADGLAGLPFVNWSRAHGDLRVAHFFALHALQAMPLLGWLITRTRWSTGLQIAAVLGGFVTYMGAVWWLFAQAMSGHPLYAA